VAKYFSEADYAMIYRLAPNVQNAFEELDKSVAEARKVIRERLQRAATPD
jgi:hypothetical protein